MLTISLPNSVAVIKRPALTTLASTTVTCFSLSACGGLITETTPAAPVVLMQ